MTISQRKRKERGFFFSPAKTDFFLPLSLSCVIFLIFHSTTNKTEETDTQTELVLPLLQK